MLRFILGLGLALVILAAGPAALRAEPGPTVLTIAGADASETDITFDMAALQALPAGAFTTGTLWTDGPQEFRGVYLATLLDLYDVTSGTLTVTAVNDYSVSIPVAEIHPEEALLAYERNGTPMSIRDKGPLWIVYPFDSSEALQTEITYARSVWQVAKLTIDR